MITMVQNREFSLGKGRKIIEKGSTKTPQEPVQEISSRTSQRILNDRGGIMTPKVAIYPQRQPNEMDQFSCPRCNVKLNSKGFCFNCGKTFKAIYY